MNENVKIYRKHDNFYLKENRYKRPKEIFKVFSQKILKYSKKNKLSHIADIGCAAGEFSYYLDSLFRDVEIHGYDVLDVLLKKAKKNVPNVKFFKKSILNSNLSKKKYYEIITCIGVISIFDSFEEVIKNCINMCRPKGKILLQALINSSPIEVNIKYALSEKWRYKKPLYWESGWNIFSQKTVKNFLKKQKRIKKFKIYDHKVKFNLKKNNDPLRTWTVNLNNKKKLMNGLNLIVPEKIIEIDLH